MLVEEVDIFQVGLDAGLAMKINSLLYLGVSLYITFLKYSVLEFKC